MSCAISQNWLWSRDTESNCPEKYVKNRKGGDGGETVAINGVVIHRKEFHKEWLCLRYLYFKCQSRPTGNSPCLCGGIKIQVNVAVQISLLQGDGFLSQIYVNVKGLTHITWIARQHVNLYALLLLKSQICICPSFIEITNMYINV